MVLISASISASQPYRTDHSLDQKIQRIKSVRLHGDHAKKINAYRDSVIDYLYKVRATVPEYAIAEFDSQVMGYLQRPLVDSESDQVEWYDDALGTLQIGFILNGVGGRIRRLDGVEWPSDRQKAQQDSHLIAIEENLKRYVAELGDPAEFPEHVAGEIQSFMEQFTRHRTDPWWSG